MTAESSMSSGWSRRRWVLMCASVMTGQLALLVGLSEKPLLGPYPKAQRDHYSLVMDAPIQSQPGQLEPWREPTLFVLANLNGFSGKAWLLHRRPAHQLEDWDDTPHWLAQRTNLLGRPVAEGLLSPGTRLASWVRRPAPELAEESIPRIEGGFCNI